MREYMAIDLRRIVRRKARARDSVKIVGSRNWQKQRDCSSPFLPLYRGLPMQRKNV